MRKWMVFLSVLLVLSFFLSACGSAPTATPAPTEEATEVSTPEPTEEATPEPTEEAVEPVVIRWFVGLGTGGNPEQIEAQQNVVDRFNAEHEDIQIELEIVQNDVAYDTLKTEIASGNPPDIVGPVGMRGANEFEGMWLDLSDLIESHNYDMSDYDPATVEFYRDNDGALLGIPFAVYPSFIYYNRDLFDEAGLPYPPHKYGEPYADGDPWTVEKLEEIAMKLTVDANGNDATSPDFDPENIVQFGYLTQWTDPRGQATLFGPGSFVDENGNAQIPENWRAAFHWYYDGMWSKWFIPNGPYQGSDLLAAGNPFNSGNLAMAHCHLWYTCCLGDVENWDIAATPSYNGQITSKLHADTFRILNTTEHPDEAFTVLAYLLDDAAPDLLLVYGAMPAHKSLQAAFFEGLDEKYPQGVDWQVAIDSLSYADHPSHESWMPNFAKADDRIKAFQSLYENTPDLDIDAELDKLRDDLQAIFDEVK